MKIKMADVRNLIREALGALRMLDTLKMQIIIHGSSHDVKVEEILTDVRIIKGVATVSQDGAINRTPTGRRVIDTIVTFDSERVPNVDFVQFLGKELRKISAIDSIIFKFLNDRPIVDDRGKRLVY